MKKPDLLKKLPNYLSIARILVVPIFVILLIRPSSVESLWATFIFMMASLTDWLDGYLARLYQAESILGKLLDPLADKIIVMAALVMLTDKSGLALVPGWIVVLLLSREFMISGLRSVAAVKGIVVSASRMAKHKTAWTMIAISFLLVGEPYVIFGTVVDFPFIGLRLLWLATFLSIASGISYGISLRRVFLD